MLEWLGDGLRSEGEVSAADLTKRLLLSVVAGVAVAAIYRLTRRSRPETAPLVATLVLLTVLIALVTMAIGNSVARAFSLVGALSIVRFRTVVEDARDTAFVIFAVAVGMALGTGFLLGAAIAIPVVGLAAGLLAAWEQFAARHASPEAGVPTEGTLRVRLGIGFTPEKVLGEVLARYLESARLVGAATARQGAALDLTYQVRWRDGSAVVPLVNELNRCEGVQEVEVKS